MNTARITLSAVAAVSIFFAASGDAWGQAYKCKDEKGRTTYSDTPCEGRTRSIISTQENSAGSVGTDAVRQVQALELARSREQVERGRVAGDSSSSSGVSRSSMSASELENRKRELEIDSKRLGGTAEQRAAAKGELGALERGSAQQLDRGELRAREDLYKDAGSLDKSKRQAAGNSLEKQTDRYESADHLKQRAATRAAEEQERQERQVRAQQAAAQAQATAEAAQASMKAQIGAMQKAADRPRMMGCNFGTCRDTNGNQYRPSADPNMFYRSDNKTCRKVGGGQLECR